jgi:hypothetical protein
MLLRAGGLIDVAARDDVTQDGGLERGQVGRWEVGRGEAGPASDTATRRRLDPDGLTNMVQIASATIFRTFRDDISMDNFKKNLFIIFLLD